VWVGASGAFVVQSIVAVIAGGLLALLPKQPVRATTAALFFLGAVVLLTMKEQPEQEAAEVEAEVAEVAQPSFRRVAFTTFGVLFAAEWGDLSQVLTAAFAARYRDPVAVGIGATSALVLVAGLGALSGRALLRVVPAVWLRRIAACVFGSFAVVTAIDAARL